MKFLFNNLCLIFFLWGILINFYIKRDSLDLIYYSNIQNKLQNLWLKKNHNFYSAQKVIFDIWFQLMCEIGKFKFYMNIRNITQKYEYLHEIPKKFTEARDACYHVT